MTAEQGADDQVPMAVDDTRCIGGGQCELLADEVFEVDDDRGVAAVLEPGLLARSTALDLVDRCPSGAISFTEPD
ncbi:MAG: ferredoxin [Actinomycetota bacterium]